MSVRTCEQCETDQTATGCTCGGATSESVEVAEVAALRSDEAPETTVALSARDQVTAVIDVSGERTVALSVPDGDQTVRLAAPAVHRLLFGELPRQRKASDERVAMSAITSSASGDPTVTLPVLLPESVTPPRNLPDTAMPRLPKPISAEELAAERLSNGDDGEDADPHILSIVLIFLLALAVATGAGYVLATSLSGDIQAFFDAIVQGA